MEELTSYYGLVHFYYSSLSRAHRRCVADTEFNNEIKGFKQPSISSCKCVVHTTLNSFYNEKNIKSFILF